MTATDFTEVFDSNPGLNTQAEKDFLKTKSVEDIKKWVQGDAVKLKNLIYRKYHVENFKRIDDAKIKEIKSVLGDAYDKLVPTKLTKWASKWIAALQALAIHCVENMQLNQTTKAVADILEWQYITSHAVDGILGPNTLFLLKEIANTSLWGAPIEDWNGIVDDALYTKMINICKQKPSEEPEETTRKTLVIQPKYLNTDGTLKSVGPVRIDQILDMTTSSEKLQITHGGVSKTIIKWTVKISGNDVNTYVYEEDVNKRVKIYDGDKIEAVKPVIDEKLEVEPTLLIDQLTAKSGLACDLLKYFNLEDDDSINKVLVFVKNNSLDRFATAMNVIKDMVHVPTNKDLAFKFFMDDLNLQPEVQTLLKNFGIEDAQFNQFMTVVNGDTKKTKLATLVNIKNALTPYMNLVNPEEIITKPEEIITKPEEIITKPVENNTPKVMPEI